MDPKAKKGQTEAPDPAIKQLQVEMKKLGLYDGPTDGVSGPGTKAAISLYEQKKRDDASAHAAGQAAIDQTAADAKAKRDREDAEAKRIRDSQTATEQQARDAQTGAILAGSVATGLGTGFGGAKMAEHFATPAAQQEMTARAGQLKNLASTIRAVNPQGADAPSLYKDAVAAADAGKLTKTPVPWGTVPTGLGLAGFGAYSTWDRAPNSKSDTERALWTGTGYGEMSAGTKMLYDSMRRYNNPGVAYPADDLAAVMSARRMANGGPMTSVAPPASAPAYTPPQAPPPPPPPPPPEDPVLRTPSDRLSSAARAAGAKGKLSKSMAAGYLTSANINDANRAAVAAELGAKPGQQISTIVKRLAASRTPSSMLIPAAVGYGVYDALKNPAQADDGSTPAPKSTAEALAYGTGAGAATAGAVKGGESIAQRLMQSKFGAAVIPAIGKAVGAGFSMANPVMMATAMDDGYQFGPEEIARGQAAENQTMNTLARNLPAAITSRIPGLSDAAAMSQVPEPSPVPRTERLQNAGALAIPDNIPPNAARDADMAAQAQQGGQAPQAGQAPGGGPQGAPDFAAEIALLRQHGIPEATIKQYIATNGPAQQ